jgi:HAE1 family hydrophobic/amphiphilic exporter-1
MSIPRLAIHRPVTMFMLSSVVVLLGAISLTRLPVDLMPEFALPTISVSVNYSGVGPLEIEQLITRPLEQAVSAVAGLAQVTSSSQEGRSQVRLNFGWGTDMSEALDEVRTRVDRVRGRMPQNAEAVQIFKADSTAQAIINLAVEGDFDPVTLREIAQNELSTRLERVPGVAAITVNGGLRRQIHVELSKEKITALNLSVDRVVQMLRQENQNTPLGEVTQGDSTYLVRSQGEFTNLDDIRNLVVMTRDGVPIYVRDIAEVIDATEDRRQFLRIDGRPGVRMSVNKQTGENTVAVAAGIKAEMERINREVPGIRMLVTNDQSTFITEMSQPSGMGSEDAKCRNQSTTLVHSWPGSSTRWLTAPQAPSRLPPSISDSACQRARKPAAGWNFSGTARSFCWANAPSGTFKTCTE